MLSKKYSFPESLKKEHDLSQFSCEDSCLNNWLLKDARKNEKYGASRTYVVCMKDTHTVVAFYSLAVGSIARENVSSGNIKRNMPNPIPLVLLGRLAVDDSCIREKIGSALVADAIKKAKEVSTIVGVRALMVHARNESLISFYENLSFEKLSEKDPCTLLLSLSSLSSYLSTKK